MKENKSELDLFSAVFEQYKKPYTLFAYSYVRDMDEAEDIYMEVMTHFWECRKELSENIHLPSYILTSVKNRALNSLRQQQVRTDANEHLSHHGVRERDFRISSLEACDPSELFSDEIQRIVEDTLQSLPEQTRLIFFMSRYENKANKEIAETLGVNIKTVEYHITRALKAFRKHLKDYLPFYLLGII